MDKHIPNEKELIRPRRLCLRREIPEPGAHNFACGANYLAARWFNSACGANYPHQEALLPSARYERRVGVSLVRAAWERRPEGPAYLLSSVTLLYLAGLCAF